MHIVAHDVAKVWLKRSSPVHRHELRGSHLSNARFQARRQRNASSCEGSLCGPQEAVKLTAKYFLRLLSRIVQVTQFAEVRRKHR